MNFATPAGFRDVLSEEAQQRELIARAVQDRFASCGYAPIETPTLEAMDVMRASGRLPGSPFKFFDSQGDLLAMRPDVTLQVARMVATRLPGQPGPFRFRYMQRVFREAEVELQAAARELTQMGVECIGVSGPEADAEVVGLLAEALSLAGVRDCTMALATVGVLRALLEASGAPAWWKEQVLDAYHASNFVELDRLTSPEGAVPPVDPVSNPDRFTGRVAVPPPPPSARCRASAAAARRSTRYVRSWRRWVAKTAWTTSLARTTCLRKRGSARASWSISRS